MIRQIGILDETEGEYAFRAQPYTFVLRADLIIEKIYNGWWYVGRPTLEELRLDLRTIMARRRDYGYESCALPETQQVRIPQIPQQEWANAIAFTQYSRQYHAVNVQPSRFRAAARG